MMNWLEKSATKSNLSDKMKWALRGDVDKAVTAAAALGIGMALMYFIDPERGRARRALLADKLSSATKQINETAGAVAKDATNRAGGIGARLKPRFLEGQVSDEKLAARIRSSIGRAVSTPGAIETRAENGKVILTGVILKRELKNLMSAVWNVRGVEDVDCRLEVHEQHDDHPALQGARRQQDQQQDSHWKPGTRVLAGATGTGAALLGMRYRPWGLLGTLMGGALLARAIGNRSLREIARLGPAESVHLEKEIFIDVPPERIFQFWRRQENFPNFMRHVREVTPVGDRRYRWRVAGPVGRDVEWESMITDEQENRRLSWSTTADSSVYHCGTVSFEPEANGTRVRVAMDYTPVGGALGNAVARVLGRDPKTELDDDLLRVKTFLETGKPAHDAAMRQAQAESPPESPRFPQQPRSIH